MIIRPTLLTLAMFAAAFSTGCGGGDAPIDSGLPDQAVSNPCAVNNGGCSVSPMVLCGLNASGESLCAACPAGYRGDGRVCTELVDECARGTHSCSPDATCTDTTAAYTCECLPGYFGDGVVCQHSGCADAGQRVRYRLSSLNIPTLEQAADGATVGHDVDFTGDVCSVPDFVGNVDNSLIALVDALTLLNPDDPFDLRSEIDDALACPAGSSDCSRMDLIVSVQTGSNCALIEIENGDGDTLAGPIVATLDESGNMRGRVSTLVLTVPSSTESGAVDIDVSLSNVIITGNVTASSLTEVVLGGVLARAAFETTIMQVVPLLGGDITFEDIGPILTNLYDVPDGDWCTALSVGFTGAGTLYAP